MAIHSIRGYARRLISKSAFEIHRRIGTRKIDGVQQINEKILTFSIRALKLSDSLQLMSSSLGSLVSNLYAEEDKVNNCTRMKNQFLGHMGSCAEKAFIFCAGGWEDWRMQRRPCRRMRVSACQWQRIRQINCATLSARASHTRGVATLMR